MISKNKLTSISFLTNIYYITKSKKKIVLSADPDEHPTGNLDSRIILLHGIYYLILYSMRIWLNSPKQSQRALRI